MNIEEAKKIVENYEKDPISLTVARLEYYQAKGFIEGWNTAIVKASAKSKQEYTEATLKRIESKSEYWRGYKNCAMKVSDEIESLSTQNSEKDKPCSK